MLVAICFSVIISVVIGFLCVYTNRQEISVQRMVGATHRFILAPHRLLVFLHSLVAAAFGLAISMTVYRWIAGRVVIVLGEGILIDTVSYRQVLLIVGLLISTTVLLAYLMLLGMFSRVNVDR